MYALVAVPVPQLPLLTYRLIPDEPPPLVGARVVVPIGRRSVTGLVVDLTDQAPAHTSESGIKQIAKTLDAGAFVPSDVLALARWTADYYASGPGEAITSVLPPKSRGLRADAARRVRVVSISAQGIDARASGAVSGKQGAALDLLIGSAAGIAAPELARRGFSSGVVARLVRSGLATLRFDTVERDPFTSSAASTPAAGEARILTDEQTRAVSRLEALAREEAFRVVLLQGVTGSGKTEVYLRLAAFVKSQGRGVLMLVPEIALTPAVASAFRAAFGEGVAVQHSGLSDGERHDQWHRIRRGEIDVVVGTRSAVFAPMPRLGLVVVDEEHDTSYKQDESPRYNGRDVAIVRAQQSGAMVVLGSATPSMESYRHACTGKYERITLERRVLNRPLASVTIVDMREEFAARGPDVVLSGALTEAIGARLSRGEQALVLLNRRGYATSLFCRQCAATLDCPNCSVSLVVHGQAPRRRARCHYCNYSMQVPSACWACAAPYLEQAGFGTERVEAEVKQAWPSARVARLDRDAIRRKGAAAALLSALRGREIDVLVGTQMIAKGHDFPGVTLVGVVSADVGLGMADFRASERTFQLLTQVAGRAGRGESAGEAIIQTIYPEHYSIQLACRQEYGAFFEREQDFRRKMRYPPFAALINIVVRAKTARAAMEDAGDLARAVESQPSSSHVRVLGPAPAPLGKLRGEYRAQILIKGTSRTAMRQALTSALAARPTLARRTIVDVDPLSVL